MWLPVEVRIVGGEATGPTWLAREPAAASNGTGVWLPLRRTDQQELEAAEAAGTPDVVLVDGGRAEARLRERLVSDRYGTDPPRPPRELRRSLWLRCDSNGQREPYPESVDANLESTYKCMLQSAQGMQGGVSSAPAAGDVAQANCLLDEDGRIVQMRLKQDPKAKARHWILVAEERPAPAKGWLQSAQSSLLGKILQLKRGYGDLPAQEGEAEEEALSMDIGNVIILVHGIGEKMWSEERSGLATSSGTFRRNIHRRQLRAAGFVQRFGGNAWDFPGKETPKVPKDEVLEASWWQTVHTEELDARLGGITLPSMPQVRNIANFAVADAIYYMQPGRHEAIVDAVAEAVDSAMARFRKYHPNHTGNVVLVGHSLGGAILFELLRKGRGGGSDARLAFSPQALFTLGSPTGLFMHCADNVPTASFSLPQRTRFFNIFHPLDPVAYRIEPLFSPEFRHIPPEQVPADGAWGGVKLHHGVTKLMRQMTGEEKRTQQSLQSLTFQLNDGDRVDWVLQEDLNIIHGMAGVAGELLQALPSHSCYLKSKDVAAFVHVRTTSLAVPAQRAETSSSVPTSGGMAASTESEPASVSAADSEA
mmetsp:Transcript_40454/g.112372  ORF Transcript_40454/g.112372 Transcript_40454/m.112372 type:complete len:593 (-) Transcript_40454:56-1834(-)